MLKSVHIKNFKSLRDCRFEFRDFQVLVGANGSGKSSFLQALDVVGRALRHELVFEPKFYETYHWRGCPKNEPIEWLFDFLDGASYKLTVQRELVIERATKNGSVYFETRAESERSDNLAILSGEKEHRVKRRQAHFQAVAKDAYSQFLSAMRLFQLDPVMLAKSSAVAHKDQPVMKYNGSGIATVLDYLLASERKFFNRIEDALRLFVPRFQELLLRPGDEPGTRILGIRDKDGWEFKARQLSGGLLLFLGYLVLIHSEQAKLLLLEEPENGIHPRRLQEVVELTKHLTSSGQAQVVMSSHSPYLVDFVEKDEVSVVTRDQESGETSITPLLQLPGAVKRAADYYPGELVFNFSESELAQ